ncbi:MAG: GDYXXLXY domain-containing protein [Chloroflexi bacterium]|nr:GDYXXLXY domain-containing protein [Chloroflexota bacterium]
MKPRDFVLWGMTFVIFVLTTYLVYQRELLAVNGRVVLLELAPVDPRSLMQGDYMQLRYALADDIAASTGLERGFVVVRLDSNNVARFVRVYDPATPLAANEVLLPFRGSNQWDMQIGSKSYFMQEGHAEYYDDAKYGEMRLSDSGTIMLVGLRDEHFNLLGPPK